MSFGAAAGPRRPRGDAACPCGSGATFDGCCGPILRGASPAAAAALMRSRFTAFAVGDARHLEATWHPRTRPDALDLDPGTTWTRLEIVDTEAGGADDETGVVEFRAHWREGARRGVLHERSRFSRVRGRWMYLDGDVAETGE